MGNEWKIELANFFEELRILEASKQETLKDFNDFCEFVVEPAFENLEDELSQYEIASKIIKVQGRSIAFQINFSKSRISQFKYIIVLPQGSLKMRLKLTLRGRKTKKSEAKEATQDFMEGIDPFQMLDLDKEQVIQDIIEKYRDFIFKSIAAVE
ncbi:MAG: hypothetical protein GF421_03940 [Candidatus Aminicenantes bacterium]|nr:hypothetical protein [Candidatus Aminicenantes bacterium]